ncbi:hypothetical protein [Sphaerotilus montanus]|uniref:hypothetical protein n=1 Tax=Sphaerotilus montanus TaxID=522889 RepID=UPI003FA22857
MTALRRSLARLTRMACWLLLVAACLPTLSRLIAAADPVRAAMLAEVCSVNVASAPIESDGQPLAGDVMGGAHCAACLSPVLLAEWPAPDRRADFDRPVLRLRPVIEPLQAPQPAPAGPPIPPRAPPRTA